MATRSRRLLILGDTLQWLWHALAFISVPVLLREINAATNGATDISRICTLTVCSAVTCAFLCRWAIGNHRYLAETWCVRPIWVALGTKGTAFRRVVVTRFLCDLMLIVVHAAILCWMASSVTSVHRFTTALVCLLASDCLWLIYNANVWPCWLLLSCCFLGELLRGRRECVQVRKPAMWVGDYAPRSWTWMNLATAAILLLLRWLADRFGMDGTTISLIAMGTLAAANSYIDFRETQFGLLGGH